MFLPRFASKVEVIHRRDQLRAGHTLQQRAIANEKINSIWNTVVEEIIGDGTVQEVRLKNVKSGETREHSTDGVFIFIGYTPNSSLFGGQLAMDDHGYVIVDKKMQTSVEGVFAAGEIMDPIYRQVASSVGQGCAAAISCERWLTATEGQPAHASKQAA